MLGFLRNTFRCGPAGGPAECSKPVAKRRTIVGKVARPERVRTPDLLVRREKTPPTPANVMQQRPRKTNDISSGWLAQFGWFWLQFADNSRTKYELDLPSLIRAGLPTAKCDKPRISFRACVRCGWLALAARPLSGSYNPLQAAVTHRRDSLFKTLPPALERVWMANAR